MKKERAIISQTIPSLLADLQSESVGYVELKTKFFVEQFIQRCLNGAWV